MASAASGPSRASSRACLPSAVRAWLIEFERRGIIGARQHLRQEDMRRGEMRSRAAPPARCHSVALAAMAEREQIFFAEAAQRRAQQRRQIEIVFPLQHKAAQRDQIHHRDLFGQHDAVGARHRQCRAA